MRFYSDGIDKAEETLLECGLKKAQWADTHMKINSTCQRLLISKAQIIKKQNSNFLSTDMMQ